MFILWHNKFMSFCGKIIWCLFLFLIGAHASLSDFFVWSPDQDNSRLQPLIWIISPWLLTNDWGCCQVFVSSFKPIFACMKRTMSTCFVAALRTKCRPHFSKIKKYVNHHILGTVSRNCCMDITVFPFHCICIFVKLCLTKTKC